MEKAVFDSDVPSNGEVGGCQAYNNETARGKTGEAGIQEFISSGSGRGWGKRQRRQKWNMKTGSAAHDQT